VAPALTTTAPSPSPGPSAVAQATDRSNRPTLLGWSRRSVVEMVVLVLVAVVVVSLVRHHVAQVYSIPSGSMQPLLEPGDRVVVTRLDDEVRRGDVVVFDGTGLFSFEAPASPGRVALDTVGGWLGMPSGQRDFVKRVIGVAGDRVVCCDDQGRVSVNGRPLDETYVHPGDDPSELRFDVEVPKGRLWLMGDHRADSADSRSHLGDPGGGMVPVERVVGRVVAVAWPPSAVTTIDRDGQSPAEETDERTP
jgi:signal peptidase I